ncbi:protein transport protein SEC24 [Pancytospora philotis]|nr:protein transport protein SEC24 [Pancytospora philotis]
MSDASVQQKKQIKVPQIPDELFNDQYKYDVYETQNVPPFLSTTECIVSERYNTDPYFLRSTFYVLPVSEYSLSSTGLPLALVASPFSDCGTFSTVDGLDRCWYCRSYYSCFTKSVDAEYLCNICGMKARGIKYTDNLRLSTVECVTDAEPALAKPVFVLVLDFTLAWAADALGVIEEVLADENFQGMYENVCFVVLNRGITVFSSTPALSVVRVLDSEMPEFGPNIFFKSTDSQSIGRILALIREERQDVRESNVGCFVNILKSISKACAGVKAVWFTASVHATLDYESFLREAPNTTVDVFTDLPTSQGNSIFTLSFYTSGSAYFCQPTRFKQLASDLRHVCTRRTVYNVNLVLKLSDNLVKVGVIAPILEDNLAHTHLSAMASDSTATFQLSLNGMSKSIKYCQLQVRFTDYDGSSKLRVFNHSFTTGPPSQFYAAIAPDTVFAVLVKLFVTENSCPEQALAKALSFYRSKCSTSNLPTQFVLPETLKTLPALIQAIGKNGLLATRSQLCKPKLISFGVEQCLRFFYPSLIALSDYSTLKETRGRPLTITSVQADDIYILCNGLSIIIYIAGGVEQSLVEALFEDDPEDTGRGSHQKRAGRPCALQLRAAHNEESELLHAALDEIFVHHGRPMGISVARAGDPGEAEFMGYMVEDAINGCPDQLDYIFKLHFKVQKS